MHHVRIEREWDSPALGRRKHITVLVPPNGPADGRHPQLVLLHGYGGSRETWIKRTRLLDHLTGLDLVVAIPESGRRWFINDHSGFRYEDYLIHEVVPYVEREFHTIADRRGRAIAGFSMGAAAALMQGLRHPHLFSVVACHAGAFEAPLREGDPYAHVRADPVCAMPTVDVHERVWGPPGSATRQRYSPSSLIDLRPGDDRPWVYADIGSQDYQRMLAMNRNTVASLRRARIPVEYHEREGAHDLDYLDSALEYSLAFVMRRLARTADVRR